MLKFTFMRQWTPAKSSIKLRQRPPYGPTANVFENKIYTKKHIHTVWSHRRGCKCEFMNVWWNKTHEIVVSIINMLPVCVLHAWFMQIQIDTRNTDHFFQCCCYCWWSFKCTHTHNLQFWQTNRNQLGKVYSYNRFSNASIYVHYGILNGATDAQHFPSNSFQRLN